MPEEGKTRIPYHRFENLISQSFFGTEYLDSWEAKIEPLDRPEGVEGLTKMKKLTDQMAVTVGRNPPGIAYQLDGGRLQPIRFQK